MQTVVTAKEIILLADGDSAGAQSNARGHLFEEFVAQLMSLFGYEKPKRSLLNMSSNGIELDVTATHQLTQQRMIAECKAYSSPLSAKDLAAFYGKLGAERFDAPNLFGYFVALPRMTKDGRELQMKFESNDDKFRVHTSESILELLLERREISQFEEVCTAHQQPVGPLSDEALLVTREGLFYAAHELALDTRLPTRVLVYPAKLGTPAPLKIAERLKESASYTKGLPCVIAAGIGAVRLERGSAPEDAVVEVTGSSSDFEYQFPAAPRYFVGRQSFVATGEQLLQGIGEANSRAQVLVLNAQSGWGKSSLALRLMAVAKSLGGEGVCIDCRTATQPTFVAASLRHAFLKAQKSKVLTLPSDPTFGTVSSSLETLKSSTFTKARPLCIFFDQFENVFQNPSLTREFRDLALGVLDVQAPLLIGFSWKTDFVAFTESYPYQLRDDIRSCATVFALPPFGPAEIGELIRRLQRSCGQKIHPYLRERIRAYSQGLPWLFKKLGSHLIREIQQGTTQDELLAEVLNIQSLFENDISGLSLSEHQALKSIARRVPVPVLEAIDLAGGNQSVLQSLLNQRLLVSIGEKLDIYWDVFRDYLNQGSVPLQESYILRLTPNSIGKLLIAIKNAGGSTTPDAAAQVLQTSVTSVLNMARDLRQLGVLTAQVGVLKFSDEVATATDPNAAVKLRAAVALRRHRVYSLLTSLAAGRGRLPMLDFTTALPKAYPAVEAKPHSWAAYSRAFAYWFQFAGLATVDRDEIVVGETPATELDLLKPGKKRAARGVPIFPRSPANSVMALLLKISENRAIADSSSVRKALADAKLLALVDEAADGSLLTRTGKAISEATDDGRAVLVREAIKPRPAYLVTLPLLTGDPACPPLEVGKAIAKAENVDWSESTAHWSGKYMRSWMRAAGVFTTTRPRGGDRLTRDLFKPIH